MNSLSAVLSSSGIFVPSLLIFSSILSVGAHGAEVVEAPNGANGPGVPGAIDGLVPTTSLQASISKASASRVQNNDGGAYFRVEFVLDESGRQSFYFFESNPLAKNDDLTFSRWSARRCADISCLELLSDNAASPVSVEGICTSRDCKSAVVTLAGLDGRFKGQKAMIQHQVMTFLRLRSVSSFRPLGARLTSYERIVSNKSSFINSTLELTHVLGTSVEQLKLGIESTPLGVDPNGSDFVVSTVMATLSIDARGLRASEELFNSEWIPRSRRMASETSRGQVRFSWRPEFGLLSLAIEDAQEVGTLAFEYLDERLVRFNLDNWSLPL